MNDEQRIHLHKMISANNVEDQTDMIRDLKHSEILRREVNTLAMLKAKHKNDTELVSMEAMVECNFLFTYYTDLYNKIRKDEIDLEILHKFIDALKSIEMGEMDQHEASYEVGLLLKKIYVDSALKKAEKRDAETGKTEPEFKGPQVDISWKNFKRGNFRS